MAMENATCVFVLYKVDVLKIQHGLYRLTKLSGHQMLIVKPCISKLIMAQNILIIIIIIIAIITHSPSGSAKKTIISVMLYIDEISGWG